MAILVVQKLQFWSFCMSWIMIVAIYVFCYFYWFAKKYQVGLCAQWSYCQHLACFPQKPSISLLHLISHYSNLSESCFMVLSGNSPLAEKDKCFSIFCKMYENEDRWSGLSQKSHATRFTKHNFKHFWPKKALKMHQKTIQLLNVGRGAYSLLITFQIKECWDVLKYRTHD